MESYPALGSLLAFAGSDPRTVPNLVQKCGGALLAVLDVRAHFWAGRAGARWGAPFGLDALSFALVRMLELTGLVAG